MKAGIAAGCVALIAGGAGAQTYNLYGETGLIDIPTAEPQPDGQLAFTIAKLGDTDRTGIHFQAAKWFASTVRYTTVPDGPGTTRSDVSYDLKFTLIQEDGWMPAVALGFRDFLGDGPYGAEYLVATKEVLPGLKLTGGIGWGRLGGSPANREPLETPGGQLQGQTYFTGDSEFFGGIEWETPVEGLTLKAEYSPDPYTVEVAGGFERKSDFNFGLSYRPNNLIELGAYYAYGSTFGVQLTFTGNPYEPLTPQDLGAGPLPVRARPADAPRSTAWANNPQTTDTIVKALGEALSADGIAIEQAHITGTAVDLYIDNRLIQREPKAIGRVARILATAMPPSVETFRITPMAGPLPTTTVVIKRSDIEAQVDRPGAAEASFRTTQFVDAQPRLEGEDVWMRPIDSRFSWSISPSLPVNLFDADEGVDPDIQINASATYRVAPGFTINATLSRFLIGSEQKDPPVPTSPVPVVRSDSRAYVSGRDVKLNRLTAQYLFKPAPELYGRITAGLLERQYGGVSGEILWAPTNSNIALGAELNYAKKRDYDDAFGFLDYDIVTGHGSIYWDTGMNGVQLQLDAGRYLAGDWGATFTISRRFANGWNVEAYVTQTDVSYEDFGNGSFAKGFKVTMPLRWGLPFESKSRGSLSLAKFERDGGARLNVQNRLHDMIQDYDASSLGQNWSSFWQ